MDCFQACGSIFWVTAIEFEPLGVNFRPFGVDLRSLGFDYEPLSVKIGPKGSNVGLYLLILLHRKSILTVILDLR